MGTQGLNNNNSCVLLGQPIGKVVDPDPITLFRSTYPKTEVGTFMRSVSKLRQLKVTNSC